MMPQKRWYFTINNVEKNALQTILCRTLMIILNGKMEEWFLANSLQGCWTLEQDFKKTSKKSKKLN